MRITRNKKVILGVAMAAVVAIGVGLAQWQIGRLEAARIAALPQEDPSSTEQDLSWVQAQSNSSISEDSDSTIKKDGDTTMTRDENGDITINREWNMRPEESSAVSGGANIADGQGDMEMDKNGEYHGESVVPAPETTPRPTGKETVDSAGFDWGDIGTAQGDGVAGDGTAGTGPSVGSFG